MWFGNFGRYFVAVIVMLILMVLTAKYALDKNTNWENTSAQGLKVKIQTGLTQIYWQWQQEGRAKQIEYKPGNVKQGFVLAMTNKGLPELEKNENGCEVFLSWFIDEKVLSNQLEVTTSYIERKVTNQALSDGTKESARTVSSCQFLYANKRFKYDLDTGQFTVTD